MDRAFMEDKDKRKKDVLAYANRLSTALIVKKRKTILEADTWKCLKELEYVKYKIDQKTKSLDQTLSDIEQIEPRLSRLRDQFKQIEPEKNALEAEYSRLLDIQTNLNQKRIESKHNQDRIKTLKIEINKLKETLSLLTDEIDRIYSDKASLEENVANAVARAETLRIEIEVNVNSKNLMEGIKPESIGDEEFELLMAGDQNAEAYQSDAGDLIDKMKNEISGMKSQLPDFTSSETQLNHQVQTLEHRINALRSQIDTDKDTNALKIEVDELAGNHAALSAKIETWQGQKIKLTTELTEIESGIAHENQLQNRYRERLVYLQQRKQEMDAIENVDLHMQKLEARLIDIDRGIHANANFLNTLDGVSRHFGSIYEFAAQMFESFQSAVIDYRQLLLAEAATNQFNQIDRLTPSE